jgi:hypothetical protein
VEACQCGYTAIRAEALRDLPLGDLWPRYGYPNDLLALVSDRGLTVAEVPVAPVYGSESSGLHPGHVVSISYRILARFWSLRVARSRRTAPAEPSPARVGRAGAVRKWTQRKKTA